MKRQRNVWLSIPGDEPDRILDLIKENDLTGEIYRLHPCPFRSYRGNTLKSRKQRAQRLFSIEMMSELYQQFKGTGQHCGVLNSSPIPAPDRFVSEGDIVEVGDLRFEVLHAPGHSPGGICLYGEGIVITGDTLFAGSVGRTDLPGGDIGKLKKSFKRLMSLPDEVRVLPGHGPESTIGRERVDNFFVSEIELSDIILFIIF